MGDVSQQQESFYGGEWSRYSQGRISHPKYRTAMNVCLNGLPLEEGAWTRRSGTWHMGTTRSGADGRLINFDFTEPTPYKIEFTNAHIRLWASGGLVYNATALVTQIGTGSPAIVTVIPGSGSLAAGQQVQFLFNGTAPTNCALLQGRTFTLVAAGASDGTQWTLQDAITGDAIDGPLNFSPAPGQIVMAQVLDFGTNYSSANWARDQTRFVQTGVDPDGTVNGEGVILNSGQPPNVLECTTAQPLGPQFASFSLTQADFIDGPYLDPVSGGIYGTPSGSAVVGPVILNPWSNTATYTLGECVSLAGLNTSSLPPSAGVLGLICVVATSTPGYYPINGDAPQWAYIYPPGNQNAAAWDTGTSYTWGDQVTYQTSGGGNTTTTVYTSVAPETRNVGINPSTDGGVHWIAYNAATVDGGGSGLGPGSILFTIAPQTWSSTVSYNLGDVVTYSSANYQSLADGNYDNTPGTAGSGWQAITTLPGVNNGAGFLPTDAGRAIRLFSEPAPWAVGTTYAAGENVQYPFGSGQYWTAGESSTGQTPGQTNTATDTYWLPATNAAQWAWGRITQVQSPTVVVVSLIGMSPSWTTQGALDTLLYASTIYTWQLGAFSNSTGWPTVGCWQGGRLWLAGAISNRFDSSVSNGINGPQINMAPTAYDGTVGDSNAISGVLNSDTLNQIQWMISYNGGVACGTLHNEWFIVASQLQDPITPLTVQVNYASHFGSKAVEPVQAPIALIFVQKLGRKLMEFMQDVFTGRFRAPNLSVFAKHITEPGVEEVRYQEEIAPLIWSRMLDGSWAGCTYRRVSQYVGGEQDLASEAAIVGWHRHALGTGRVNQSIMVGPNAAGTLDTLSMVTNQTVAGTPDLNIRHVETLIDIFEEDDAEPTAWYLDDAIVPPSIEIGGTGIVINGLWDFNGLTKTVWACGYDLGDFPVANGSVTVPWGAAGPSPIAGAFTETVFEGANTNYSEFATSAASVTIAPAGSNLSPATIQWLVDQTNEGFGNSLFVADWDNGVAYFHENTVSVRGAIAKVSLTTGAVLAYKTAEALGIGDSYNALQSTACLGQDGMLYWLYGNSAFARIDPKTWEVYYQSGALIGSQGVVSMVPVVSTDGIQYVVLGVNNFTTPASFAVLNGYTGALTGSTFTAPAGSNSAMTVGGAFVQSSLAPITTFNFGMPQPVLEEGTLEEGGSGISAGIVFPQGASGEFLPSSAPGVAYGTADNLNGAANSVIYKATVGPGGVTSFETFATIAATSVAGYYTLIQALSPVVIDQTDNNLLLFVQCQNNTLQDAWLTKLSSTDGTLMWSVKTPGGNLSADQGTWNSTRAAGGVVSFLMGTNLCSVNTTSGTLTTTALGSSNGQIGGGQASDAITGELVCYSNFSQATNSLGIVPVNGTPSGFISKWARMTVGTYFRGATAVQQNFSAPVIVGSCFTSQGQMLRPGIPQDAGSQNGPALAKTKRAHMFGLLVVNSMGASVGADLNATLYPLPYKSANGAVISPPNLVSTTLQDTLEAGYGFDDMLAWEIVRPYPTTVASAIAFRHTQDR